MNRDETKKILRIISATYPNFKPGSIEDSLVVWSELLKDDDYSTIEASLYAYIRSDSTGFAPTPGQLINMRSKVQTDDGLTEGEAWSLVRKAMADGLYHSEERFAELPKTVQRAVGSPTMLQSWAMEESDTVIQSNFLRAYRQVKQRAVDDASISPQIMNIISKVSERLALEGK